MGKKAIHPDRQGGTIIEVCTSELQCQDSAMIITIAEVLDQSFMVNELRRLSHWCSNTVSTGKKKVIIDAYLALCRATEEGGSTEYGVIL